jgi:hypothetical protein
VRGWLVVLALAVGVGLFMAAVAFVGNGLRQDYRVLSVDDLERTQLDFDGAHALWLERNGTAPAQVWSYDVARDARLLLGDGADEAQPVALGGGRAAWVAHGAVQVHDFANGTTWALPGNLSLPGRTLSAAGWLAVRNATGVWVVDLLGPGAVPVGDADAARASGDLLVAAHGPDVGVWTVARHDGLRIALERSLRADGPVARVDTDGADLVWQIDPRPAAPRLVYAAPLHGNASQVPSIPGQAWEPSVAAHRVAFIQADGLVRLVDLDTHSARVLPARDEENLQPRLGPDAAAWLSGTLEGHNVLLVPLR